MRKETIEEFWFATIDRNSNFNFVRKVKIYPKEFLESLSRDELINLEGDTSKYWVMPHEVISRLNREELTKIIMKGQKEINEEDDGSPYEPHIEEEVLEYSRDDLEYFASFFIDIDDIDQYLHLFDKQFFIKKTLEEQRELLDEIENKNQPILQVALDRIIKALKERKEVGEIPVEHNFEFKDYYTTYDKIMDLLDDYEGYEDYITEWMVENGNYPLDEVLDYLDYIDIISKVTEKYEEPILTIYSDELDVPFNNTYFDEDGEEVDMEYDPSEIELSKDIVKVDIGTITGRLSAQYRTLVFEKNEDDKWVEVEESGKNFIVS